MRIVDNRSSVFNFAVADYRQGLRINIIYSNSTAKGCIIAIRIIVLSQLLPGDACSTTGSHHHSSVLGSYSDILILSSILGNVDLNIVHKRTGIAIQQINCCAACTGNSYRGLLSGRSSGRLLVGRQYLLRFGLTVHQAVNFACYLMVKCQKFITECISLVAYKSAQLVKNTSFTTVIASRYAAGNSYVDNFAAGFSINLKRACIDRAFFSASCRSCSLGAEEICLLGIILAIICALTQTGSILHQLLQSYTFFGSSIRQLLRFLAAVRVRVLAKGSAGITATAAAFALLSCSLRRSSIAIITNCRIGIAVKIGNRCCRTNACSFAHSHSTGCAINISIILSIEVDCAFACVDNCFVIYGNKAVACTLKVSHHAADALACAFACANRQLDMVNFIFCAYIYRACSQLRSLCNRNKAVGIRKANCKGSASCVFTTAIKAELTCQRYIKLLGRSLHCQLFFCSNVSVLAN